MKKLVALLLAVWSISIWAVEIPYSFCGITLGETRMGTALWSDFKGKGQLITCDSISFVRTGDYFIEGFRMNTMYVEGINDTVFAITFFGDCMNCDDEKSIDQFIAKVTEKYTDLLNNDSVYMVSENYRVDFNDLLWNTILSKHDAKHNIYIGRDSTRLEFRIENARLSGIRGARDVDAMNKSINKLYNPHYDEVNRVKSVAGCEFGDSRKNVMDKFRPRAVDLISEDAQSATYSDIRIGGQYFKLGNLYFINGKFVSCKFQTNFNTWRKDEAIATYKSLCSTYDNKYTNAVHANDDNENMRSYYGMVQSDYKDAKIPPIIITMEKGVSRGGDMYYFVTVSYFELRLLHLYDDEI